jgi:hypothetical protein
MIPGRPQILWDNEKDILNFITRHPRVSSTEVEQGLKSIALATIIAMYLFDFSKSMILGSHVLSSLLQPTFIDVSAFLEGNVLKAGFEVVVEGYPGSSG